MYELGLPETSHIAIPPNDKPEALFVLTLGTLGDAASELNDAAERNASTPVPVTEELQFSASFFDAFLASNFQNELAREITLFGAAAYYLARRPGSSLVLSKRLAETANEPPTEKLLRWVLQAKWSPYPADQHPIFGDRLHQLAKLIAFHFHDGSGVNELGAQLTTIRKQAYDAASELDLLYIDIIAAVARMRVTDSAWTTLPAYSGIPTQQWSAIIQRERFPKELWPSQILLGRAGLFAGLSGVVQMPTSAGKTRSVEIILRSAFLAGRTKLAVVVAPFRALCTEIGTSLHRAFKQDGIKVNELSDVLQMDFPDQFSDLLDLGAAKSRSILVVTPEKLLYVLRQLPNLVNDVGVVVFDEGHQFDTGSRGITYELLLTEIKPLLPSGVQMILVSAVIQNAKAVGQWLMGDSAQIVNGTELLPTARSFAFASWLDRLGQLMFYESDSFLHSDYFVPRAIEQQQLTKLSNRESVRYFPIRGKSAARDISLYLGIRLAPQGAVAIFCGRKDTAAGIAERAVDIYKRGYLQTPPAGFANPDEVRKLKQLADRHFGTASIASQAAELGIFVHHGNTPRGIRLAVEYAMQHELINFVACTSTLAQGVNLPIRYLIVSGVYQGREKIKVRDFQNLIGRAGRAGMHTEGLVIFADPTVYDGRASRTGRWRFGTAVNLLSMNNAESTTSTLLGLLSAFNSADGKTQLPMPVGNLCQLLLSPENAWMPWAAEAVRVNPGFHFDAKQIVEEIKRRRHLLLSVESYLMAKRGSSPFVEFKAEAQQLATATLAHHLATDEEKSALVALFGAVAEYVELHAPQHDRQAIYAKTLLGVASAKQVEEWVKQRQQALLETNSSAAWLSQVWPLFATQSDDKFFHTVEPASLPLELAVLWLSGASYGNIVAHSKRVGGTKPWGETARRKLTEDDVIDFCQNTLSFDCSLVLAAIAEFLLDGSTQDEGGGALALFQKSLNYGLPDWLSISALEYGFADRVVAQHLRDALQDVDVVGFFESAIPEHIELIQVVLGQYPGYFRSVLQGRA